MDLAKKSKYAFEETQKELKFAFIILIFCITVSIPLLLIFSVEKNIEIWINCKFVVFSILNTILILVLHIVIDMGKTIFLITNTLSKIEEQK